MERFCLHLNCSTTTGWHSGCSSVLFWPFLAVLRRNSPYMHNAEGLDGEYFVHLRNTRAQVDIKGRGAQPALQEQYARL